MNKKTKRLLWVVLDILLVLLICAESGLLYARYRTQQPEPAVQATESEQEPGTEEMTQAAPETESETESEAEPEEETQSETPTEEILDTETGVSGIGGLKANLEEQIGNYDGKISIYVQDLTTNDSMEIIGAEKQKAASLIKLYVMAAVYDQILQGKKDQTEELDRLMYDMITVSDNESTNALVTGLSSDGTDWKSGSEVVNRYIRKNRYRDTSMGRPVYDTAPETKVGENYTSVSDCGELLAQIYRGECVNETYSQAMYNLLKEQKRRNKIPQGVGNAQSVANKTGELDDVENDAAIVELDDSHAYVLCVMTSDVADNETAVANIVEISRTVYEYFDSIW